VVLGIKTELELSQAHPTDERNQLFTSAISLLQDYQKLRERVRETIIDIELEISSRPEYPNIGKKGCVKRLKEIIRQS
jgi:hypothetical protein